jgi:hypothetical protein
MSLPTLSRRAPRVGATTFAAVVLAVGLSAGAAGAASAAGVTVASRAASASANPYSPAYHHPYRHGVVPTVGQVAKMASWDRQHPATPAAAPSKLRFGGGILGIGVTTGQQKVYLVFYGSQWGHKGTDGHGNTTLSGDPSGEAPYEQRLFRGLGTDGETWSGVMTQYCQGVAVGAMSCPADSLHIQYPAKAVLAGVWVDESAASPSHAGGHLLAVEAVKAAKHFGNTSGASNRNAQYVILSPTGTHPDGFNTPKGQFCAWHDWNGDDTLSGGGSATSHYGPIAFTNLPYITDAAFSCGMNFINAGTNGNLDGASIVEGHEYAETITDQLPAGGWVNDQGSEAADICAWDEGPGAPAANVALKTGSFAMQSIWANNANGGAGSCEIGQPTVRNSGIFNGGFETGSFEGWTTGGAATSIVRSGVKAGRFAARAGKPTPTKGNSSVGQTFNANGKQLSFWYAESCPDRVKVSWATATLTDNTTHKTVTVLAKTCAKNSGWKKISASLVAGQSYTLTLTNHDDNDTKAGDGAYALLDAVTIP